jgi:hypothetical protein
VDGSVLTLVPCPEPGCTMPAEVLDSVTVTDDRGRAVETIATCCVARHRLCWDRGA